MPRNRDVTDYSNLSVAERLALVQDILASILAEYDPQPERDYRRFIASITWDDLASLFAKRGRY